MALDAHLLRNLVLPERYETLVQHVGGELASVLVPPSQAMERDLASAARAIARRAGGAFLPIVAESGTGKTTLANNLSLWLPSEYTGTVDYKGSITFEELVATVGAYSANLLANNQKIIPVAIDQREAVPPSAAELSAIKRFLRHSSGTKVLLLWLETDPGRAGQIAREYENVAGSQVLPIPVAIQGPDPATWPTIAQNTLRYSNDMDELPALGVDPSNYPPENYSNIGKYLQALSNDFGALLEKLLADLERPVRLNVLFASESQASAILTELTYRGQYGLLDANALLDASPASDISRWWSTRRSQLVQTIVRLEARAFCLPPSVSMPSIAIFGDPESSQIVKTALLNADRPDLLRRFERSDLGRYLLGIRRAAAEGRGTPATSSVDAHKKIAAEIGFGGGRDKRLNTAVGRAMSFYLQERSTSLSTVETERGLGFADVIPDIRLEGSDGFTCFELTWRTGEYLVPARRGEIAVYLLTKLRNYGVALGWLTP